MTVKLQTSLLAIGFAVVTGIAIGVMLADDAGTTVASTPMPKNDQPVTAAATATESARADESVAAQIANLNRMLQDEKTARQALEQKLDSLSRQLAALDSTAEASALADTADQPVDGSDQAYGPGQDWFNEQALLDNGMDSSLARELKEYFEQFEMERLYLRDRSAREGWDREKTRVEMQAIESREEELRERLGESAYDAYLYASGQPNRVAVTSVLASAQAGQAGIQSGDHIIRYDNQRIYNWMDLRSATTGGNISDTVEVQVERDGQTLQFYLARGPMGIRMDSLSIAP